MKYHPKTKPFPHQARGTLRAVRARNYALYFEPRCGKSKAALDVAGIHALAGRVRRVLILCPAIATEVWERQLRLHYPYTAFCENFEEEWNIPAYVKRSHPGGTHFFLATREEVFRRTTNQKTQAYERPKQKILEEWDPDLIIVDESHEYKRPGGVAAQDLWRMVRRLRARRDKREGVSQTSQGILRRAVDRARTRTSNDEIPVTQKPWVIELSGTPSPKGWVDLFAQFRIMDDSIFGTDVASFKERHVIYGVGRRKWTVLKYRRERELERKVRDHSYSISAGEAGLANKEFDQILRVDLPASAKKLYLQLAEEFVAELENGEVISAKNAGVKRIRLLQITGGYTTDGTFIHRAKQEKLKAYLSLLLEQGESVVVYSRFTPEVEECFNTAKSVGFRTFRVDGGTSKSLRRDGISSLSQRPLSPTAVCFQYQAGSRAIELVGAAETVYYSTPDGWVDYFQTRKRTQGPNQERPVRYTHLVCSGTVDVSVVKGLQKKEDLHGRMMQDPRRFLLGLL